MKKIGRYEIIEELGRGAMGVVYKASDPTIGRLVAIKLLLLARPAQSGLPGVKDIFLREARAAGRLSHPGIVTIHDALEDEETRSCYIVMEFVAGRTLEEMLLTGPPLRIEKALNIARQVAEALEYAHREKIVHRDLKPANILLTEDGRAKITDFGIAKVVASEDAQRTLAIMGTPAYMSPEQVTGGEIDASSDVFSLGILLYLMLTGEKPFSGDTAAVMFKIAYQDPAPPSQVRAELNKGHDFLLLRALAKDKKKRYARAREFLDDLDDIEHGRPPRSEAKIPMSDLHAGDLTVRASKPLVPVQTSSPAPAAAARKPWVLGAGIAATLLVLLAGGFLLVRKIYSPVPAPTVQAEVEPPPASAPPEASTPSTAAEPAASAPNFGTKKSKSSPSSEPNVARAESESPKTLPAKTATEPAALKAPAPAETPKPVASAEAPSPPPAPLPATTAIKFDCRYQFKEAQLTVVADGRSLFKVDLQGRRTGKLLGLRHGYEGTYLRPLKIPAGTRNLTIHFQSGDGSVNLTGTVAVPAPNGKTPTLHVNAGRKDLKLNW
jgi:serine/threonine protein kinase